jgi:hypothetical protein
MSESDEDFEPFSSDDEEEVGNKIPPSLKRPGRRYTQVIPAWACHFFLIINLSKQELASHELDMRIYEGLSNWCERESSTKGGKGILAKSRAFLTFICLKYEKSTAAEAEFYLFHENPMVVNRHYYIKAMTPLNRHWRRGSNP